MVGAATHTLPSSFTANCATLSGRDAMVQAITNAGSLPLRAYGECLNNMPPSERGATKVATLRKYQHVAQHEPKGARPVQGAAAAAGHVRQHAAQLQQG